MRKIARSLAVVATAGLVGSQAFGQTASIAVGEAAVHAVPADADGPFERNAVPGTLNAQYAAQAVPAPAPAPAAAPAQSRAEEGPAVSIAPSIIDSAGAFASYMRRAAAIDPKFADAGGVAKAVSTGSAYEIGQFQEGAVAYAALAALQDAAFVQAVYDLGRDARDRDAFAAEVLADPRSVLHVEGADEAAVMVGGVLARMGAELVHAGEAVKTSAYEVQHQAWSKEPAPNPQRLAETKAQSAARISLSAADTDALIRGIVALRQAETGRPGRAAQPSPIVVKGLALAALAVVGRAEERDLAQLAPLLSEAKSADCMKMAKLNLYQCMASAGPHYEDVFCVGQHALVDTGQCVIAAAGQSPIPPTVQKASAPVSRSVSVPIALSSTAGPERQRAYGPAARDELPAPNPPPARELAEARPPAGPAAGYARPDYRDEREDRDDPRDERDADERAAPPGEAYGHAQPPYAPPRQTYGAPAYGYASPPAYGYSAPPTYGYGYGYYGR